MAGSALAALAGAEASAIKAIVVVSVETPKWLAEIVDDETTPTRPYHLSRKRKRRRALTVDIAAGRKAAATRKRRRAARKLRSALESEHP